MMKKRVFSLLLVLAMVASMLPLAVFNVSAATLPEITGLHRGVLADGEAPDMVYWDAVDGVEKYEVKVTQGTATEVKLVNDNCASWTKIFCAARSIIKDEAFTVEVTGGYSHGNLFIYETDTATIDIATERQPVNFVTIGRFSVVRGETYTENLWVDKKFDPDFYYAPYDMDAWDDVSGYPKFKLVDAPAWIQLRGDSQANGWFSEEVYMTFDPPADCTVGTYEFWIAAATSDTDGLLIRFKLPVGAYRGEDTQYWIQNMSIESPVDALVYWNIWKGFDAYEYLNATIIQGETGNIYEGQTAASILKKPNSVTIGYDTYEIRPFAISLWNADGKLVKRNDVIDIGRYRYQFSSQTITYRDPATWVISNDIYLDENLKVYLDGKLQDVVVKESGQYKVKSATWEFYSPWIYVYDEKPVINSVTVNGTSVADGGTTTANNGNVTIKTNYDSKLSDALTAYGCSVKQLSAYYLNGAKINVAALTPVDNGDGTATKTYTRALNPGDELRVESWLEVKWPDGHTDRVDEHTVTVSRPAVAFDFANQNPVGSADKTTGLTATSGETKSYTFGSTAVPSGYYVEKKATLKGLFAGLDADQTVTVKDGSATLTHTFIKPGMYQLTETLKLYENGSTKVIATKSHQFLIEVAAADPAFVTQPHYEGKGMQTGTNYVSWKLNFTPVKLIARVNIGTTIRPNWKEYELDPTKSFAALMAYSQKYVLYAYYGEGARDYVASEAFSAEKPADFTPAFTKQPVGDQSLGGNPVEVTWATNFVPVKITIMQGTGVKPTMEHSVLDDATATSTLLGASENNYFICAYYSDTEYVTSNKFKITELAPAFTLQPANGVSLGGAYAETSWATNFTPVKLQLVKINYSSNGRPFYTYEELDVDATYCTVQPGFEKYCIRAYFNDTQYVDSNRFIVTEMNYYNAWFYVDDTVLDKVMVLEGDYVARPADPVKDGYRFLGWYTDDDELYNFAAPVTADVHLTAWFEQITYYVVTFMVDDSEWYSCAVSEGEAVAAPTVPEKDGYKFLGWSYEGAYYDFAAPVTGDMTLYAEYEKIVTGHTVAFHLGTDPVAWQEVQDGDTAVKPEDPAQEGKTFLGWYTAPEGGTKFDFATPITGDVNLYARFEDASSAIPGDVNGDGKVNNRDLGRLQQFVNGWDVVIDEDASDVTGDGKINNRDLGLLQQFVNGWDVVLK